MMWHLFIESGLHDIKRHMDFGLQECKIIIISMDIPTGYKQAHEVLGQSNLYRQIVPICIIDQCPCGGMNIFPVRGNAFWGTWTVAFIVINKKIYFK